jgi:hypothetical protein
MTKKLGFCWYLVFILIIVSAGIYLWGYIRVKSFERRMKERETEILQKTQIIVNEKTKDFLKITALPLVWAVRKDMMRGNYEQINDYMERLVQEKGFKEILLVDPRGIIGLATDKKLQGQKFADYYPAEILEVDDVRVFGDSDIIRVAAPVMGINAKLGVLVFTYTPEKVDTK